MPPESVSARASDEGRELGERQERVAALLELGARHGVTAADEAEVLVDGECRVHAERLRHVADPPPQRRRVPARIEAEHGDAAAVAPRRPTRMPQQRRLARAIGANHPEDHRPVDRDVETVERDRPPETLGRHAPLER